MGDATYTDHAKLDDAIPWPQREPLPGAAASCPRLPIFLIPKPIRGWIVDSAQRLGVLPEFVGIPALGFLAIVLGCRVGIRPKQFDPGWVVVTSHLWVALIASSGTKKTPALNAAQSILSRIEKEERAVFAAKEKETRAERATVAAKIEGVKAQIKQDARKNRDTSQLQTRLDQLLSRQVELEVVQKRFTTNDATIEKLGMLLSENKFGMGLIADELVGWMEGLDRAGCEAARAFFLKAHGGTSSDIVDRVGRGTVFVERLSLHVVGSIQPEVLSGYVAEVHKGGAEADGLLARLQLAFMPDTSEVLPHVDREADGEAFVEARDVFDRLAALAPEQIGLATIAGEVPAVQFDLEAQGIFDEFLGQLEVELQAPELSPALRSHLAKQRGTMPALALLFEMVEWASSPRVVVEGESPPVIRVRAESARNAAHLCDWLGKHARAIYGSAEAGLLKAAHALAKRVAAGDVKHGTTLRQLHRNGWSSLSDRDALQGAAEVLDERNWLRVVEERGPTGRPSLRVLLHPDFRAN